MGATAQYHMSLDGGDTESIKASHSNSTKKEPSSRGAEEYRGRRLLPHVIDYHAQYDPHRIYAIIPKSGDMDSDLQNVEMQVMASAVNYMAWWIDRQFEGVKKGSLAYVGPSDLRYPIMFLASMKCRWKMLFISPRNTDSQNANMLRKTGIHSLLYAADMKPLAERLQCASGDMAISQVPEVHDMLAGRCASYEFDASFEELQDECCLILHSSGSTGCPKLVYLTHGTFSVTDNDTYMPVPEGRRAQNAAQFNFSPPGSFYSCFPPYHMAGVQAYTILPTFSKAASVVMGPPFTPPSGFLLSEILKKRPLRAIYIPPFILEQWASDQAALKLAEDLDFVLFGGGPLAPDIGHKLSHVTDVCQMYGSLELGQIQMLVPLPGQWEYLEPNPYEECDMQLVDDCVYEMVLHQEPKFRTRRSLSHNFPDIKTYRTRDLFVPHESKPGLWRFHSRVDDMIVLSSSHKLRPLEMETILQGDESISAALITGNGRPEPLLILEPTQTAREKLVRKDEFIDRVWPSIAKANSIAPTYARIRRSRVILGLPELPFIRTPKGTISRKATEEVYSKEIAKAFTYKCDGKVTDIGGLEYLVLDAIKKFIRSALHALHPDIELQDDDDFFSFHGMDSFTVMELGEKMRLGVLRPLSTEREHNMWLRMIYGNPSIKSLAAATLNTLWSRKTTADKEGSPDIAKQMRNLVEEMTCGIPGAAAEPSSLLPSLSLPADNINIVLLGARGRLGPYLVRELLQDSRVGKIRCLNRGLNGRRNFGKIAADQNLKIDIEDERLQFHSIDLSKPNLGLTDVELSDILAETHVVIHNIWRVDFSLSVTSYKKELLNSVRSVVDLLRKATFCPRFVFVSSIASVQDWESIFPESPAPEEPVDPYEVAWHTGYGQSKHVAERVLATAANRLSMPITILRLGQLGPATVGNGGKWSSQDWIQSMALLSKITGLIPKDMGIIDWVPVDTMSKVMCEIILRERDDDKPSSTLEVYNLVNPRSIPFNRFADLLQARIGLPLSCQVGLSEWVKSLEQVNPGTIPEEVEKVRVLILPFFQSLIEKGVSYPGIETAKAREASPTMANMKAVDEGLMKWWCEQWIWQ